MPELSWSFIQSIRDFDPKKKMEGIICIDPPTLSAIRLDGDGKHIPEGLLLECCAQAAGLFMVFRQKPFRLLPVLVRVNEGRFHRPLERGREVVVVSELVYESEDSAEFLGRLFAETAPHSPYLETRLMLGLTDLASLPDGGEKVRTHLDLLKRRLSQT